MSLQSLFAGGLPSNGPLRLAATDIAGYLRLEQCERYLRLQLQYRNEGDAFLAEFDVAPQPLPALLTGSGAGFEQSVIEQIRQRMPVHDFVTGRQRANDNAQVVAVLARLQPGETLALTQPRLHVPVDGWDLRGDLDLLILSRDEQGALDATVLDMKSSSASRIEHRVQIALYAVMIRSLCTMHGIEPPAPRIGIVYRGASEPESLPDRERERQESHREAAQAFGLDGPLLDLAANDALFQDAVDDLVLGRRSVARTVARKALDETTFCFTAKCDGCFFNEFCLKASHEGDDLSLIPFMGLDTKSALRQSGIATTEALATLKAPRLVDVAGVERRVLAPSPGKEAICHDLGDHRAVAGRLDELVARARKYRKLATARLEERNDLSGAGYGTLPYCDAEHDPNLIRVFLDVQRDYLHERLYLARALVQGNVNGSNDPDRRRTIVAMSEAPPEDADTERDLLVDFTGKVLRSIIDVAAPDENGELQAPIHLIFYERGAMKALLQALGRHAERVLGATPLYDFITQLAAFDSPLVTVLSEEIRTLKNYPILAPSLQAVARYLGFDWDEERPLTTLFRSQVFDDVRPVDEEGDAWFTGRARFSSNLPLEYAYNTWGKLPPLSDDSLSERASYRTVERDDLLALARRRLEAMERVTADFRGNDRTFKTRFLLPDLALFEPRPESIAAGIDEFILTEQHVALSAWRSARQAAPEQRMLNGTSLIVRYLEGDQEPGIAEANREHARRAALFEEYRSAFLAENPDAEKVTLPKDQREATRWDHTGMQFRFEILHPGGDERLERLLGLSDIRVGDRVLIAERWSVDSRLPAEDRVPFQTTPKQLLYGDRGDVIGIERVTDGDGSTRTLLTLQMAFAYGGEPGFVFRGRSRIFEEGQVYTLETDPNNIMLSRGRKLARAVEEGALNALTERLGDRADPADWPDAAATGQARFLEGMNAFTDAGALHAFEPQKHRYIGSLGGVPTLLVQGPPGTGKSYTTAFAIWARVQGALAAGLPYRVLISCKTHAATDVLLKNVADVQRDLKLFRQRMPELWDQYFDARLLDVPVYRYQGKSDAGDGIRAIFGKEHPAMEGMKAADLLAAREQVVAGMTPGGVWKLISERWSNLFANRFINLLVLDEASQMSLPEAAMSSMPLELDGQLIVVGDHRQMPPIVQHDWANEARRSFKTFAAYESLYLALDRLAPEEHKIKFAESFRLHRDMAEFLKREIYYQDGINFFSRKTAHLAEEPNGDAFADAVLGPEPLVVIAHDEMGSQTSNPFEQALIDRLVQNLDDTFEATRGLGVVVPHRAQRAVLQEAIERLSLRDPATRQITLSSVDTVERFQGDERRVIVVGLTESDPYFIRTTSEFLLDPRRLTVALSRAKEKMIVIASRSVFGVIAADEETFVNAGLWKNLLRRTCTETRWSGAIDGYDVEVRVNPPLVR